MDGRQAGVLLRRIDHPMNMLGHENKGGQAMRPAMINRNNDGHCWTSQQWHPAQN